MVDPSSSRLSRHPRSEPKPTGFGGGRSRDLARNEVRVLAALRHQATMDAPPLGHQEIAARCGLSNEAVQEALAGLYRKHNLPELADGERRVVIALCSTSMTTVKTMSIAKMLNVTESMVKSNLTTLFRKFGVDGYEQGDKRLQLAHRFRQSGLVFDGPGGGPIGAEEKREGARRGSKRPPAIDRGRGESAELETLTGSHSAQEDALAHGKATMDVPHGELPTAGKPPSEQVLRAGHAPPRGPNRYMRWRAVRPKTGLRLPRRPAKITLVLAVAFIVIYVAFPRGAAHDGQAEASRVANGTIAFVNLANWDRLSTAHAVDCVFMDLPTGQRLQGRRETMAHIAIWRRAFPDLRGTVLTRRVLSDGRVYLKVIWQGTHAGPLKTLGETIPASNRHIIVPSELFIRVRDGQVVETSHLYDREALLRQIGAPQ